MADGTCKSGVPAAMMQDMVALLAALGNPMRGGRSGDGAGQGRRRTGAVSRHPAGLFARGRPREKIDHGKCVLWLE